MIRFLLLALPLAAECLPVEGRILARELARVQPSFASVDPGRVVSPAPLAGVRRVFSAEDIARVAQRFGVPLHGPPPEACFEGASQTLNEASLQPVLERALGMERARIEIGEFSRYAVAPGRVEFARSGLSSNGLWRGRVVSADGHSAAIWVRIHVFDRNTGERIELAPARVPAGSPQPKEIERGDTVRVEISSGGVLLAFDAAAETSGRTGDTVLIRNPENGRRFQATVEEKGKVRIRK